MYIKYPHSFRRNARLLVLSAFCLVGSFTLGLQTSGNVQPVALIEAGGLHLPGDMDGNGVADVSDAMIIIEIAQGY
ncbi:MAG: hypothetical protein QF442_02220, partial [Candidatus Peribacteraceae bacterium]|nr:hypothetical protein [Candidatus Peribacteraceae bacterium]